jgi:predicted membrane channel-forming protein YqfA (hemolysin III family)
MKPTDDTSARHPATYCWPLVLAFAPAAFGYMLGATGPDAFRKTHFYYEIAFFIALLAATGYSFRLWKHRRDPRLRLPLYLNLGFIMLAVTQGFVGLMIAVFK